MQVKLLELAATAEKAALLQVSANEQQTLALQAEETATTERAHAAELEDEAATLIEKSEADAILAEGEGVQVEELGAHSATEEEQSAAHAAAAAVDETTIDTELAEATADAVQAARAEAEAHGEEVGIGICEFVPGLDIVCSVVGGITAVGMEGFAAGEAVKASGEAAAAAMAKTEEEREIALSAELQAKAAEDAVAAADLASEQAAEEELAEDERIAGQEKQAEADALLEHAEVEEDTAAEEETTAGVETGEAASLVALSITQGVEACWDAIMATAFGIAAFLYFGMKTIAKILPSAFTVISMPRGGATVLAGSSLARNTSYNIHHGLMFILTFGIFSNVFNVFGDLSLQARGGLILGFGAAGACVQTLALHYIPIYLSGSHNWRSLSLQVVRSLICLSTLYVLEILILWAAFGERLFTNPLLRSLHHWMWWVMLSVPLGVHLVFLEIPHVSTGADLCETRVPSAPMGKEHATESDALLPTKAIPIESSTIQTKTWWSQVRADLAMMQLPFEFLMATCMVALLIHCVGATLTLWPASKGLLLASRPEWLIPLAVVAMIVFLIAGVISIIGWWRRSLIK
jgi:hypothetical protein